MGVIIGAVDEKEKVAPAKAATKSGGAKPPAILDVGSATSIAPSSLTAGFRLAKQSAKGTVATTNYLIGRLVESSVGSNFDYTNQADEHFYATTNPRATSRKSKARRTSYVAGVGFRGYLHSQFIGMALLGLGYKCTTTGPTDTTAYTHEFVLADRDDVHWMSAISRVGEGAGVFERRITDMRLDNMTIEANSVGIVMQGSGYGITEGNAVGTETGTTEPDALILPTAGALVSLTINGEDLLSPIRSLRLQMRNALDTTEIRLWNPGRADLAQIGTDFSGVMRGIDLTTDAYKLLQYGALAGTGSSLVCPEGEISFTFESTVDITGSATTPNSITFTVPTCEWRMSPIAARGSSLIRYDLAFSAIDTGSADPVEITLVNGKSAY
jgi:hypothetical protein